MNALGIIIAANIAATFVTFCGLKLFDIGSDLADIIRKYGVFLGIVFAIVAIFNFLLPDTLDLLDGSYTIWTVTVSMVAFAFLEFLTNIAKHTLLIPKRKKSRKRGRMSKLSVAAIAAMDIAFGCIAGAAAGISFTLHTGTGFMVLCALTLLQIISKVASIRRYQDAGFTRKENITVLALSLCASPIVATLVSMWAHERYRHIGVFMAVAIGYIAYICLYHLVCIVKKYKKC
ncbi:MAG: hypothetical protein MJ154_01900 [Candidatus Saccharibacteria bacterium]|nr:hypothetical protein [Candidatus Saccharibacteria bacterium]